jgi:hypothetical protein
MKLTWNWGLGIALVYATFAGGTMTMVAIASSHHVDLVSADYYERSLAVDAHMSAVENGRGAGVRIEVEPSAGGPLLAVTWPVEAGGAMNGTITLYRPSSVAADRVVAVGPDAAGRQTMTLTGVAAGRWQVQVYWTRGGREFYVERDVITP